MKTKPHLPAFTLSEIIVVMLLSSVLVGLAFSVLLMTHKHFDIILKNLSNNTKTYQLEEVLWLDFNRYCKSQCKNNQLVFTSPRDTVIYQFNKDFIQRNTDTFDISLHNINFYFDGNHVDNHVVDALKLKTGKELQQKNIFIYKQKDAKTHMRLWPSN